MWIFCVVFYLPWIATRTLSVNRVHSKSFYVLRDHLLSNLFMNFFLMSSSWRQLFSLSTRFVNSTRILTSWSPPLILVDTISRDVTRIKIPFKQFTLGFIFFQELWSAEFTSREKWLVKCIFREPWWEPYLSFIFVSQL
jgi:hypothetical protein